jgi:hypothetical protein
MSLTFEFGGKTDANEPSDAIFVESANTMVEIAKKRVGKYDPEGKNCNCIGLLVIAGHGGGGGELRMGEIGYNAFSYETDLKTKARLTPEAFEEYLNAKGGSGRKEAMLGHEILTQLASLKCKNIKVVILECNAGEGENGKLLGQQLKDVFGVNATVITYEGQCGFSPLFHTPMPKWDIFNGSKKKNAL